MPDRSIRLAPLYDLVSTVYYEELTDKMAMKIGKQPTGLADKPKRCHHVTHKTLTFAGLNFVDMPMISFSDLQAPKQKQKRLRNN